MNIGFIDYIQEISSNLPLLLITVLTLAVVIVNGWTDAPNAIATCVSTRSIRTSSAVIMASFFNFLGVLIMTVLNSTVAQTICSMVDFGTDTYDALVALCASMFAIVVWATAAWWFGIPTSESHALIAGISGAAIALQGGFSGINEAEWIKVIYGLLLASIIGFLLGFFFSKLIIFICRGFDRRRANIFFSYAQIASGAGMAFMHGAQDGQKFIGVFMLGIFLAQGKAGDTEFVIPLWLMIGCSITMALGTSIGGYRIIKSVGMDMVKLEKYQGFSADLSAISCLFISSIFGIPTSTTHTKVTAIMGVGASRRLSSVNWSLAKEIIFTWILTFPGCGIIGFLMARFFMKVF